MKITIRSVLVSDAVDPLCVDLLRKRGITVTCKYKLPKDQLIQELQAVDALIVRSDTKVTKDVINSAPGLKVIGRAGTGVDNIDLDAATKRGIIVINTPGGNSISACELTCALISTIARNVPAACQSLKEGRWDRKLYTGSELNGKTLAILGLGRIGREVAFRMQSYGMKTIGFDPIVTKEQAHAFNVEKLELDEIWPQADYVTVHTPLIPQTRNLINEKTLNKSKKGVVIVNVARGGIVDEGALLAALKDGRCGGAALDVYEEEPPKGEVTLELIKHPLVVATPHLGASTDEAQQRVAVEVAEQFIAISGNCGEGENFAVTGAVNAPVLSATLEPANLPWIDLTLRLGQILGRIGKDKDTQKITVITKGGTLAGKTFLTIPALAGALEIKSPTVNLINAPGLAKEHNLTAERIHEEGNLSVTLSDGENSVTGTLGASNLPVLTSLNSADFKSGVGLVGPLTVVAAAGTLELATLVKEVTQANGSITNIAIGRGKKGDVAIIHTAETLKLVSAVGAVF